MAKTMPRILLAFSFILTLLGLLSGGFLNIPFTATLSPAIEMDRYTPYGASDTAAMPASLQQFIQTVSNGNRNAIVGIYVPGVLALPVGQQPKGNAGFVTRDPDQTTLFGLAKQYGTVGILAHNDLAGQNFSRIRMNQYSAVVYGDGHVEYYMINEVQKYQALTPTSTFSDFVNLSNNSERLSASDLFNRIYAPGNRLVFQTCIASEEDPSWGRMFIIATPANRQVKSVVEQTTRLLEFASFGLVGY